MSVGVVTSPLLTKNLAGGWKDTLLLGSSPAWSGAAGSADRNAANGRRTTGISDFAAYDRPNVARDRRRQYQYHARPSRRRRGDDLSTRGDEGTRHGRRARGPARRAARARRRHP